MLKRMENHQPQGALPEVPQRLELESHGWTTPRSDVEVLVAS